MFFLVQYYLFFQFKVFFCIKVCIFSIYYYMEDVYFDVKGGFVEEFEYVDVVFFQEMVEGKIYLIFGVEFWIL